MQRLLTHWFITAIALATTSWILSGVHINSLVSLIISAFVLGFINAIVKPVLVLLTLPLTLITLGLFYFVVNGLAFGLAAALVPGFSVASFAWAIFGAIMVSLVSWFIGSLK